MKYILLILSVLIATLPITGCLMSINRESVKKNLGFIFRPIPITKKLHKFFWGKWTMGIFECEGIHEISLIVLILLPFYLIMYILLLLCLGITVFAGITYNENLIFITYRKYVDVFVIYTVALGIISRIILLWADTWKEPKIPAKERRKAYKDFINTYNETKRIERYFLLSDELMNIAYFSNDEEEKYIFEVSQVPQIKKMVSKCSKKAALDLKYQNDRPYKFVVLDKTNNETVFQGFFKE